MSYHLTPRSQRRIHRRERLTAVLELARHQPTPAPAPDTRRKAS